jgi:multicomponent Na+:H+ antiporter subunit E
VTIRALRAVVGRPILLVWLAVWATIAITKASAMVARDIVAPSARLVPGVLILPLRSRTSVEVALLAGLITLTPGTLVVGVDRDFRELWVHGMYAQDPEALRAELAGMETRVLRALRYPDPVRPPEWIKEPRT